jgi:hypothetical protein
MVRHIGILSLDQDAVLGKGRGRDMALYGGLGEEASERVMCCGAAGMMERREKGGAFSKVLVSLLCFYLLVCMPFTRCLSVSFSFLFKAIAGRLHAVRS